MQSPNLPWDVERLWDSSFLRVERRALLSLMALEVLTDWRVEGFLVSLSSLLSCKNLPKSWFSNSWFSTSWAVKMILDKYFSWISPDYLGRELFSLLVGLYVLDSRTGSCIQLLNWALCLGQKHSKQSQSKAMLCLWRDSGAFVNAKFCICIWFCLLQHQQSSWCTYWNILLFFLIMD